MLICDLSGSDNANLAIDKLLMIKALILIMVILDNQYYFQANKKTMRFLSERYACRFAY